MSVPVQGAWKACPLTIPPFAPSWESLEEAWLWQEENCISDEEVLARSPQSTPEPTTIRSESMASTHCD
ncbi:MAG: hypothetical protein VKJ46_14690 [Leptolyngbyaceae bacterium]|nr:hypothetical protein [Leptolyngbyaceae bacterium]